MLSLEIRVQTDLLYSLEQTVHVVGYCSGLGRFRAWNHHRVLCQHFGWKYESKAIFLCVAARVEQVSFKAERGKLHFTGQECAKRVIHRLSPSLKRGLLDAPRASATLSAVGLDYVCHASEYS